MINLENSAIAIQKSGRLTAGSLRWLNNYANTDFLVSEDPFDERRELTDTSTGITVVGYSNGDTLKLTAAGQTDFAIAGSDKYYEAVGFTGTNPLGLVDVKQLGFAACRMVLARPEVQRGVPLRRIVTAFPRITRHYFESRGNSDVAVDKCAGGIESIARRGGYDGLVDVTDSGKSLIKNGMEVIDTVLRCEALLVARTSDSYLCMPEIYDAFTTDTIDDLVERRLQSRQRRPTVSLASQLVNDLMGNGVVKKIAEECGERIAAQAIGNKEAIVAETADCEFTSMAGLVQANVPYRRVKAEKIRRYEASTQGPDLSESVISPEAASTPTGKPVSSTMPTLEPVR